MLIDLHNHTAPLSWDSRLSPDELISQAKESGLDGVCLTEHDEFWPHQEVRRLSQRHGFLVLPGAEITTEEGHLLVFGLEQYLFGMHRSSFVKGLAERAGGVILLAHPYRGHYRTEEGPWVPPYERQVLEASANPALDLADAIETLNGRGTPGQNRFSSDVCRRRGMPAVGASDAHQVKDIGVCATEFQRPIRDLDDLIAELRAGRFCPLALRNGTAPNALENELHPAAGPGDRGTK